MFASEVFQKPVNTEFIRSILWKIDQIKRVLSDLRSLLRDFRLKLQSPVDSRHYHNVLMQSKCGTWSTFQPMVSSSCDGSIVWDKNDFSVITRFLHIAVVQGDQPLTEFFIQRMKSRGIDIYNKLRQVGGNLATSFSWSLNFPPPGAIEVREEERPWERGWRRR